MKALLVIFSLLLLSTKVRADDQLYCATVIALGKPATPRPVINRLRLEISLQFFAVTGRAMEDSDLDQIFTACLTAPWTTVREATRRSAGERGEGR